MSETNCETTTVYIVTEGEKHEGGSVRSVHATKEGALSAVKAIQEDPINNYRKTMGPRWQWRKTGDDWWETGCDYIMIEEMEVHP